MARVIEIDPASRIKRLFHWNESVEEMVIETQQDVEPIIEDNLARFNQYDERSKWGDGDLAARIPMNIVMDLVRRGIFFDDDALKRWLDERDHSVWKVRPGKLAR